MPNHVRPDRHGRSAAPSARQTICSEVGNPLEVKPFGIAAAHRSRKLTQRVNTAGVVFWSMEATGGAGVTAVGVSSASTPCMAAVNEAFIRSRSDKSDQIVP